MAMVFGCLDYAAWGQNQPYGMTERLRNVSLVLELEKGVPPATISTSGLFSDIAAQTPAPRLILYSVNAELWSDGAYKTRFLALPGEADVEFSRDEFWHFPANTVLVKNFYLEFTKGDPASRQIVETRFVVKVGTSEEWRGFRYKWNDDPSDAVLLRDRETLAFFIEDPEAEGGFAEQITCFSALKITSYVIPKLLGGSWDCKRRRSIAYAIKTARWITSCVH